MEMALIVPVLNRFDLFTKLIRSVDEEIRVFVIESYENNRGVSGAWNEGIRRASEAGYRYAIISNDDVEFYPGSILSLYKTIKNTNACLVSALQNGQMGQNGTWESAEFFCFAIDIPQLLDKAGYFDENFFPAYWEDIDMHRRLILAGAKCLVDMGAPALHHISQTQNFDPGNPVTSHSDFDKNKSYLIKKWGITQAGDDPENGIVGYQTPFNDPNLTIRDWNKNENL